MNVVRENVMLYSPRARSRAKAVMVDACSQWVESGIFPRLPDKSADSTASHASDSLDPGVTESGGAKMLVAFAAMILAQAAAGQAVSREVEAPGHHSPLPANPEVAQMARYVAEAQEAGWLSCVDGSARHQATRAGRAGIGVPPVVAAFGDCLGLEQALKEALMSANPTGGSAAADTYIRDLQTRLSPQLAATMSSVYQSNNYE